MDLKDEREDIINYVGFSTDIIIMIIMMMMMPCTFPCESEFVSYEVEKIFEKCLELNIIINCRVTILGR